MKIVIFLSFALITFSQSVAVDSGITAISVGYQTSNANSSSIQTKVATLTLNGALDLAVAFTSSNVTIYKFSFEIDLGNRNYLILSATDYSEGDGTNNYYDPQSGSYRSSSSYTSGFELDFVAEEKLMEHSLFVSFSTNVAISHEENLVGLGSEIAFAYAANPFKFIPYISASMLPKSKKFGYGFGINLLYGF